LTTTCWPSRLDPPVPWDDELATPVARRLKAIATPSLHAREDLSTLER
jgi:hypothetical protein